MSSEREEYAEDVCPNCGSADWEVDSDFAKCNDCGYRWVPYEEVLP